jgi:hypothetical protein
MNPFPCLNTKDQGRTTPCAKATNGARSTKALKSEKANDFISEAPYDRN